MIQMSNYAASALCLRSLAALTEAIGSVESTVNVVPRAKSTRTPGRTGPTPKVSDDDLRAWHAEGLTDYAIQKRAGMLGMSARLRRMGLAPNGTWKGGRP